MTTPRMFTVHVPFVLDDGTRVEVGQQIPLEEDVARHFGPLVTPVQQLSTPEDGMNLSARSYP